MPLEPNQQPSPGQRHLISTQREQSGIPKGGTPGHLAIPLPADVLQRCVCDPLCRSERAATACGPASKAAFPAAPGLEVCDVCWCPSMCGALQQPLKQQAAAPGSQLLATNGPLTGWALCAALRRKGKDEGVEEGDMSVTVAAHNGELQP